MDESVVAETAPGLIDLTGVPLDTIDSFGESALAPSVARLLAQIDQAGSSVGGHDS